MRKPSCAKDVGVVREILTASAEGKAVVKLPCARKRERKNTLCSVVHNTVSRDVISEIHTRETIVSYVSLAMGTSVSREPTSMNNNIWNPSVASARWGSPNERLAAAQT